jgi:hypothetical protein
MAQRKANAIPSGTKMVSAYDSKGNRITGTIGATSGTSVFDPVLCEIAYSWFMPQGAGRILDPFSGGSVRGIVASILGKQYVGIDLSARQVEANKEQAQAICSQENQPVWISGDSKDIPKLVAPVAGGEADMVTASRFLDPALTPKMPWLKPNPLARTSKRTTKSSRQPAFKPSQSGLP